MYFCIVCFISLLSVEVTSENHEKCTQSKVIGPCRAAIPRFWYNGQTCEQFLFGGCDGNLNNFKTKEDCEQACLTRKSTDEKTICLGSDGTDPYIFSRRWGILLRGRKLYPFMAQLDSRQVPEISGSCVSRSSTVPRVSLVIIVSFFLYEFLIRGY